VKTRDNCLAFVAIAMILTARAVCSVCMLVCLSHDIHIYADFLMRCSIQWLSDVWQLCGSCCREMCQSYCIYYVLTASSTTVVLDSLV